MYKLSGTLKVPDQLLNQLRPSIYEIIQMLANDCIRLSIHDPNNFPLNFYNMYDNKMLPVNMMVDRIIGNGVKKAAKIRTNIYMRKHLERNTSASYSRETQQIFIFICLQDMVEIFGDIARAFINISVSTRINSKQKEEKILSLGLLKKNVELEFSEDLMASLSHELTHAMQFLSDKRNTISKITTLKKYLLHKLYEKKPDENNIDVISRVFSELEAEHHASGPLVTSIDGTDLTGIVLNELKKYITKEKLWINSTPQYISNKIREDYKKYINLYIEVEAFNNQVLAKLDESLKNGTMSSIIFNALSGNRPFDIILNTICEMTSNKDAYNYFNEKNKRKLLLNTYLFFYNNSNIIKKQLEQFGKHSSIVKQIVESKENIVQFLTGKQPL